MAKKTLKSGTLVMRCKNKRDHLCPGPRTLHVGMFATVQRGENVCAYRVLWLSASRRRAVLLAASDCGSGVEFSCDVGDGWMPAIGVRQHSDGLWWEDGHRHSSSSPVKMGVGRQTYTYEE